MVNNSSNQQILLSDGRRLAYNQYGSPDGKPVFFFHGHPGSRLDWPGIIDTDDSIADLNARVIAVDRPGHGLSDFKPGRQILDWPEDVCELADSLQLDRFAVLGISGGGPYAAACAYKIPDLLTATGIVSGMGPLEAPGCKEGMSWIYAGKASLMRKLVLWLTAMGLRKKPDKFISATQESMKGPDRSLIQNKHKLVEGVVETFAEALCQGIAGAHYEAGLYASPWGFMLEDIAAEVHLWHGEQDDNVLVSVGRYVARAIPNCHAKFIENEGHISLIHKYLREYLNVLVA